jgi:di/tricarboxylate transporter
MAPQLAIVLGILAVTVLFIVTEWIRIDVVAITAMLSLVWAGSISAEQARSGFSSNAVLAIIGVMIMGRGLYKAGVTEKIAQFILSVAGSGKRRIISTVSMTVGVMSGFMQNIGAAALFLPVMTGISKREKIPISSLLMPMGFAALLGGTMTMVGTSSLIVLNDLLSNRGFETFGLLTVTPIGLALLGVGVLYFLLFGDLVLPKSPETEGKASPGKTLLNVWGLSDSIFTLHIPEGSEIIGETIRESDMGARYNINLLRVRENGDTIYNIWESIHFESGQKIVVQGRREDVEAFVEDYELDISEEDDKSVQQSKGGYLEVLVPARSSLVGKTLREVPLRETYHAQVVLFFSESEVVEENVADRPIQAGDTLVLHGTWDNLQFFKESEDFIAVTPFDYEPKSPEKAGWAVASFVGGIGAVMALDLPISVGFLTGAVAMILGGILTIEDAYRAVEWKVIFLISGLIPIGIAMEESGAAAFVAENLVAVVQGMHPLLILGALGVLTTLFSLFMSNVAATVLMVPLVLKIGGDIAMLDSRVLVLQIGLCAANSFIIPTHHVNALLMTPGGYQVSDYLKAGSILSVLFIAVSSTMLYVFYA